MSIACKEPIQVEKDLVKALRKNDWGARGGLSLNMDNLCYWVNKKHTIVREHWDPGLMEFSLPNSMTGFFDECVMQYIHLRNPDANPNRFVRLPQLDDPYDDEDSYVGRMMM